MKNVPPIESIWNDLNKYEQKIYNEINYQGPISVRGLLDLLCNPNEKESMGKPTLLKYLKALEQNCFINYIELKNQHLYEINSNNSIPYKEIKSLSEKEFERIEYLIIRSLSGIELLNDTPEKQFAILNNCLKQIFGYQILIKITKGIQNDYEQNNAINKFWEKLEELEDQVYSRITIFMEGHILDEYRKMVDESDKDLIKLLKWKWELIQQRIRTGDEEAISHQKIHRRLFGLEGKKQCQNIL